MVAHKNYGLGEMGRYLRGTEFQFFIMKHSGDWLHSNVSIINTIKLYMCNGQDSKSWWGIAPQLNILERQTLLLKHNSQNFVCQSSIFLK